MLEKFQNVKKKTKRDICKESTVVLSSSVFLISSQENAVKKKLPKRGASIIFDFSAFIYIILNWRHFFAFDFNWNSFKKDIQYDQKFDSADFCILWALGQIFLSSKILFFLSIMLLSTPLFVLITDLNRETILLFYLRYEYMFLESMPLFWYFWYLILKWQKPHNWKFFWWKKIKFFKKTFFSFFV